MKAPLGLILRPGLEFTHEYDFGSTTELRLKVIDERPGYIIGKEPVYVMARNEAPVMMCENCHQKPARVVCTNCSWEGTGWLCEDCARNHKCGPEMFLPVVNSPRVGECGYCGDRAEENAFGELMEVIWESYAGEDFDDFDDDDEVDDPDAG